MSEIGSPVTEPPHCLEAILFRNFLYGLKAEGLFERPFRISPKPVSLPGINEDFLTCLGHALVSFYRALDLLYREPASGHEFVRFYLDRGKPAELLSLGLARRFRQDLPRVLRPDLLLTPDGPVLTEMDSVPGGPGLLLALSRLYRDAGQGGMIGGSEGILEGFAAMIRCQEPDPVLAIVVSDESEEYRGEMSLLARSLSRAHFPAVCIHPRELHFDEEGLFVQTKNGPLRLNILYRFFELFDLSNIPKAEMMLYFAKGGKVRITPPLKPWLEEKAGMALWHHPVLRPFWVREMPDEARELLDRLIPQTWILDPAPVPFSATVTPPVPVGDRFLRDFSGLFGLTQKERRFIIKPSGFSPLAWGSRGVVVGHDLPEESWHDALQKAFETFDSVPFVLQPFRTTRVLSMSGFDFSANHLLEEGYRVRVCPYFFVLGNDQVRTGGVLATACPKDKKLIHGMVDAILSPVWAGNDQGQSAPGEGAQD